MNRSTVLRTVLVILAPGASGQCFGQEEVMANRYYTLRWNAGAQQLSVVSNETSQCRITALTLPEKVQQLARESAAIPQLGDATVWRLRLEDESTMSVMLFDELPWVGLRRSVVNASETDVRIVDKWQVLNAQLDFQTPASDLVARGTAGLYTLDKAYGSYVFGAVANPQNRAGVVLGWASNLRGQGVVFPGQQQDVATIAARVDYGDLRLAPQGQESGELLLLGIFADVRAGFEQYADATARYLEIQLRPLPGVYCTWYHAGASDETRLARNTDFAAAHLRPWGLSVMQIDDKWQPGLQDNGPKRIFDTHDPAGPYPHGMKATADHIRAQGMVPGIWFMPFSGTWLDPYFADKQDLFYQVGQGDPSWTTKEMANQKYATDRPVSELPYSTHWAGTAIDCTNPKSREYIRQMVQRMSHEWGYKYFKMDGFHTGSGSRQRYIDNQYQEDDLGKTTRFDPSMTPIEGYRLGMQTIRDTAGEDVFFLGCCQVQNLRSFGTTFGMLDAMRVGPDNGANWKNADRGPRYGGRYYFLNKRVWHCDPDPFYVRPSLTYSQATTLASWVALAGQLTASSYDYDQLPPERLDIIRRVLPTHNVKTTRPLDFLQRDVPQEWMLTDETSGVRRVVVGHFNWHGEEPVTLATPLEELGLDPAKPHVGFDYWGNAFVEVADGVLRHELDPASCKIVALYEARDVPQLVSTSRHVTQGIIDVRSEKWDADRKTLCGSSDVVANDPYELRIALPASGDWAAAEVKVTAGTPQAEIIVTRQDRGLRVRIVAAHSGAVDWEVHFEQP